MNRILTVIGRESPLSVLQVKEVFDALPELAWQLKTTTTYGDQHKEISLMQVTDPDFFTRELDEALLNHQADVAIHSAKDLPYPLPIGLEVYALTAAQDTSDALVSRDNLPLEALPAGARIGTSSKARKAELLKWRSNLEIVSIRGTIEERLALVDRGEIDALIVATCALQRLQLAHRITQRLPFQTHPLQGHLAIVGRVGEPDLRRLFQSLDIRPTFGTVTLVGFGPGNPDLLTLAGDRALQEADVILYDDLLDATCLSRYQGEQLYVGKRKGEHYRSQEEINQQLASLARSGKQVVRLKGGDAMLFARGREEVDYLQSQLISVKVIPGVSAGTASAAYTGIPLTHRNVAASVAFVTAHSSQGLQVPDAQTVVYYMGGTKLAEIAQAMLEKGYDPLTPVALAYHVSYPDQQVFYGHLRELLHWVMEVPTPILVIVGKVVSLAHAVSQDPILVTGTDASDYVGLGRITHTPLIRIEPLPFPTLPWQDYDWILFTSRYGVRYLMERLRRDPDGIDSLQGRSIGSVGPTTTHALRQYGVQVDWESPTVDAAGILRYFEAQQLTHQRILLPRSEIGIPTLKSGLEALGNQVTDLPIYTTRRQEEAQRVDLHRFARIYFASPSAVDAFVALYGKIPTDIPCIAKGNTTEQHLRSVL